MGTVIASDIFRMKMDSMFVGMPRVTGITDHMIAYGSYNAEHDKNLFLFLEAVHKNGLKLNKD